MLAKARHFVPSQHLLNIYHAIFASHLMYGAQVWTPKLVEVSNTVSRIQKTALRIITFSEFKAHHEPLCKKLGILKFVDYVLFKSALHQPHAGEGAGTSFLKCKKYMKSPGARFNR